MSINKTAVPQVDLFWNAVQPVRLASSMALMMLSLKLNSKNVFIFDDHHAALLPWSILSSHASQMPYIISLDHHTDTISAFCRHAYWSCNQNLDLAKIFCSELVAKIDRFDEISVRQAIENLRHDEHIDAAIRSGIISHSFSIQHMDSSGTLSNERKAYIHRVSTDFLARLRNEIPEPVPPFTYEVPVDKMFVLPRECAVGCQRAPHDDQCEIDYANQVLEDIYLTNKLQIIEEMSRTSGIGDYRSQPYILDIDLDYFHTLKGARPRAYACFHALIRGSIGVTIAREADCVESLRLDGETMQSSQLEQIVLQHIDLATR